MPRTVPLPLPLSLLTIDMTGRVTLIVTTLPEMSQVGISEFESKKDLIDALMASAHIPLVLDLKVRMTGPRASVKDMTSSSAPPLSFPASSPHLIL